MVSLKAERQLLLNEKNRHALTAIKKHVRDQPYPHSVREGTIDCPGCGKRKTLAFHRVPDAQITFACSTPGCACLVSSQITRNPYHHKTKIAS